MFIYYDPETLEPGHVVFAHDAGYDPHSNGEHHVHHPEMIDLTQIHLKKGRDGKVQVLRKQEMDLTLLTDQIKLGSEATIIGVPKGASITVNGDLLGKMKDTSGTLDIAPEHSGFYKIRIALAGYHFEEFDLEVVR